MNLIWEEFIFSRSSNSRKSESKIDEEDIWFDFFLFYYFFQLWKKINKKKKLRIGIRIRISFSRI